jgi:murein DD-endopeptidase MepM/ murein hydrolase activator NlpD
VPPADTDAPVRARSPQVVRALLLGACAAALLGLSVPHAPAAAPQAFAVEAAASSTFVARDIARYMDRPAGVSALRATRSRALTAATHATKKAAHFSGAWFRPSYAGIVSPFGMRWGRMHKGVDFGARYGAPIRAIGDGVVVGAGYLAEESGYGEITLIRHADGYVSAYAHQSRILVHTGDRVAGGQLIGYVGSTGHATGAHLHFEIRTRTHSGQINPARWLRKHGVSV